MPFKLRSFINQDLDQVFSYNTSVAIKIRDLPLGFCYRLFQLLVFVYIFIVVKILLIDQIVVILPAIKAFFYNEAYYEVELSQGLSVIQTSGSGFSVINADTQGKWDASDITPILNGNTLFVATQSVMHYGQQRGTCKDFYSRCDSDADCDQALNEDCSQEKCIGKNWCNSNEISQVVHYESSNSYIIWIKGAVEYDQIYDNKIYSNLNDKVILKNNPSAKPNAYLISDILQMNKPFPLSMREIKETGAVVQVNVDWTCGISSSCTPSLDVHRIDYFNETDMIGAYYVRYQYYKQDGVVYRDLFNMTGVKFIFNTKGKGIKLSVPHILLQIATFLALMRFATMIFDVYVLNFAGYKESLKKEKYSELENIQKPSDDDADTQIKPKIDFNKRDVVSEGEDDENGDPGSRDGDSAKNDSPRGSNSEERKSEASDES